MTRADFVIVGSGLTGATIARTLVDHGCDVLVLERRPYPGGNIADFTHPCGVVVHRHGPHYFRTSSQRVWDYVNRFASFHPFEAVVRSRVDGRLENWPIAASYLRRAVGCSWSPEFTGEPRNFEEAALAMMPRLVYEKFVQPYSEKQWGVPANSLSADLCRRFDVREDDDPRLTPKARFQGIPRGGYSRMVKRMLDGIPIEFGCDYLRRRHRYRARQLTVFTGPIDLYFDGVFGRLHYRGQRRETEYVPDRDWVQPCVQVNEPDRNVPHLRTIEWKHLVPEGELGRVRGTVITRETPNSPTEADGFEYPFPDKVNGQRYLRYRELASRQRGVRFCGRLGEYRYYDMDQAIGRALRTAERFLETLAIREPVGANE